MQTPATTYSQCHQNPRYDIFITEDGRRKKLKKELPPGLSPQDERALKTVQRKAYRYEWWFGMLSCCSGLLHKRPFVWGDENRRASCGGLFKLHKSIVAEKTELTPMYRLPLLLRPTRPVRHRNPMGPSSCRGW